MAAGRSLGRPEDKRNDLIENIRRDPFRGIGQPEPLKAICRAGGPGASTKKTGWSIAFQEKTI
jgi:hypothetical protein